MSLLDSVAKDAMQTSSYVAPPLPNQLQGQPVPEPPLNVRERVMQQHQEIAYLRERVGNLEAGIEKLARMLVEQMGLQL